MAETIKEELSELLTRFVSGADRSQALVRQIGEALAEAYPDPETFPTGQAAYEDVEVAAACYRPGGSSFMYDEGQAASIFQEALIRITGRK